MASSNKGNIFFLVANIYIIFILIPLVSVVSSFIPNVQNMNMATIYIITSLAMLLVPITVYFIVTRDSIKEVLSINKISIINVILICSFCIFIQPFLGIVSYISTFFYDNVNVATETIESLIGTNFILGFISIAVVPAIFEELFMRGIIQWNYKKVKPVYIFILNGLMFGILHQNLQQFFYAFFIGCFLSIFVYYTKSIFASMIGHFTINGSQFVLGFASIKAGVETENIPMGTEEYIGMAIWVILTLAVSLSIFYIFYLKNIKGKHNPYMEHDSPFNVILYITIGVTGMFLFLLS